ncbi:flavodoxin-dependent (E)-4-hydroxy-3-methylbut-2-enyl-diphosphate synthase [Amycolatopsis thermoflava]|uniref:flavodoxin-dependent (E)-4-hydroxy-3-methylbut-2-enyl-diphosphate synthase n=1 Tax=Amycolatopsis thermoflava TaxID=84480 RepID=UPI00365A1945
MTAVPLGAQVPAPRRNSRQVMVGDVPVGGGAPVPVQSMTVTADVDATLRPIAELTSAGCQEKRRRCRRAGSWRRCWTWRSSGSPDDR